MRSVVILFGGVLAFTACAIAWTLARERVRRRRMGAAASALSLSPSDGRALLEQDGLAALPLFALAALGARVQLTNVARGQFDGLELAVCDYRRASGTPGNQREHRQTLACFPLRGGRLPDFVLEPVRGVVEEMAVRRGLELLGGVASRFAPSRAYRQAAGALRQWADDPGLLAGVHPELSRRYRLLGSDEAAVRAAFGPRVLEFFAHQKDRPIAAQSARGWLVIFRHDVLVRPEELRRFLQEATSAVRVLLADLLPG